jgi:signal transduction histidine kinase
MDILNDFFLNNNLQKKDNRKSFSENQLQNIITAILCISKEIQIENLIQTLLEICLNLTSAKRGALVLTDTDCKYSFSEIIQNDSGLHFINLHKNLISNFQPASVMAFYKKCQQSIISGSLNKNHEVFKDKFFEANPHLVFMLIPIIKSNFHHGFFYLEFQRSLFDPGTHHLEMMQIIASQAAISLENARLYENLNTEIKVRTMVERALHLSEKKLNLALQDSESANVAKNQFIANMSHEIRTPLNGILGMAELLQDPNINEQDRMRYLDIIHDSGCNLLTILNDILDLAKIEAGKITIQSEVFIPAQIIKNTAKLYTNLAMQKNIQLTIDIQKECWFSYLGDPGRIKQVLNNLLSNSIKFTEKGKISVCASVHEGTLQIEVRDTGIGISEEFSNNIFKKFTQADQSTSRKHSGSGLGLSIAKQLCLLMKGEICVESQLNKGSTFWFQIPLSPANNDIHKLYLRKNYQAKGSPDHLLEIPGHVLKVLIVEDNQVNAIVVGKMLHKLGHNSDCVSNGKQAVEAVKKTKYDLVLMDCQMPEMDGYEATKMIRFWEIETKQTPLKIIALTAAIFPDEVERCYSSGMDKFLRKPIDLKTLSANLVSV